MLLRSGILQGKFLEAKDLLESRSNFSTAIHGELPPLSWLRSTGGYSGFPPWSNCDGNRSDFSSLSRGWMWIFQQEFREGPANSSHLCLTFFSMVAKNEQLRKGMNQTFDDLVQIEASAFPGHPDHLPKPKGQPSRTCDLAVVQDK